MSTYVTSGTSTTEQMLRTRMANTIVLPKGVLVVENEIDRATVGRIKGLGVNLVVIP